MKNKQTVERVTFGCVFVFIALALNGGCYAYRQYRINKASETKARIEQAAANEAQKRKDAEALRLAAERKIADEKAAAQKKIDDAEAFSARYLNTKVNRETDTPTLAVATSSEDTTFDRAFASVVAGRFGSNNVRTVSGLFTAAFMTDGLFTETFNGSLSPLRKLELTNSLDVVILARQSAQYSTNKSFNNTIVASLQLEVVGMPVGIKGNKQGKTFSTTGLGFSKSEALAQAEERALKQIANDTNQWLYQIVPSSQ